MDKKNQITAFMAQQFPHEKIEVLEVGNRSARIKQGISTHHLRPGGTVSGPTLVAVADTALYVAILGEFESAVMAVTINININFLRKPSSDCDVVGVCQLLKVGKSLVVGEVTLYSEGGSEPVAHVVGTYSLPPGTNNTKVSLSD